VLRLKNEKVLSIQLKCRSVIDLLPKMLIVVYNFCQGENWNITNTANINSNMLTKRATLKS